MTISRLGLLGLALYTLGACTENAEPQSGAADYSRVVSLAPNLTELVFAAGAAESLVGVSAYSDYPEAANKLPVIGDAFAIDEERLALLEPDLILVWASGTPARVVDDLRAAGYIVEIIETRTLEDVATALRTIGRLTGTSSAAETAAKRYLDQLRAIGNRYGQGGELRVFYQVDERPLYTISGRHYVSELISLCGGSNIFGELDDLAPTVDVEAVIEKDPEVLLASTDAGEDAFAAWRRWPHLAANRYANHFLMPADEIGRATPRLLIAADVLCTSLQDARGRRDRALAAAR